MITLDDDHPIFDRSTGTAVLLELFSKALQFGIIGVKPGNGCHRFAFSPFNLSPDTDDTVQLEPGPGLGLLVFAGAAGYRFLASGTDLSGFSRIDPL